MANVGRKAKLTREKFLDAVRRKKTLNDKVIGSYVGMNRSSVYRFKKDNPSIINEAKALLDGNLNLRFTDNISKDSFSQLPVIVEWYDMQITRRVKPKTAKGRISMIYSICKFLKTHPDLLELDRIADLIVEIRNLDDLRYKNLTKEKHKAGTYYSLRTGVRSFFQLIHGISGELLTAKGIGAEASRGAGSSSKQHITKLQRREFEDSLLLAVDEVANMGKLKDTGATPNEVYVEVLNLAIFMYYTGTRIGSDGSDTGCANIRFENEKNSFQPEQYIINLTDKGKGGGIEWDKVLIDDALVRFKRYIVQRFHIPEDNLEARLRTLTGSLFPWVAKNYETECLIMKKALTAIGINVQMQNHFWRHAFAQDFLGASDHNYELTASVGGWKDTGTLKKSYGAMSDASRIRGLRKAMGLKVEDVTYKLMW